MQIDLTPIILTIIALFCAVLSTFAIPWLKTQIEINKEKLTENQRILLKIAIDTAVKAAEQLYNSNETEQKKAYVIGILESQGYTVNVDAVDAAIEAAVLELHEKLKE